MPDAKVRSFRDVSSLNAEAARIFALSAVDAVSTRGRFLVALSGGGTPEGVYALLGDLPFKQQIPWAKSHLFWGDERLVPPEHPGSNYGQVARLLLARLPLPPGNVHRAKGELTEEACVADYKAQLKRFAGEGRDWPRFDLVLLGMGSDGHTASLFPGPIAANEWREPVVSVNADYDGRPSKRITLTPLVLNGGRRIVFLVTGTKKAKALAAVLQGPYQPETWPAQRIRCEQCSITWLVDEAAAALLPADNPGFDELP